MDSTLKMHSLVETAGKTLRLSVVGLGKLGSPMVAVFAKKGFDVIGLDINQDFVKALNEGLAPVEEPGLQDLIDQYRDRISATEHFHEAVQQSDVTFVIVPTPSQKDYFFTNKYVVDAVQKIGYALRSKKGYHLVVVTSTVMPGSTDGEIRDALETASGRSVGPSLGLCYNPEFIALGSVIRDMLYPDMILIGESDTKAGEILEGIYKSSTESNPEIHRMTSVNAELTKISVNTYVTTKISYANMISDMCDHLPGADAHVVNRAVGADSRVGRKYLKSAVGYGGPCFPRDNKAFAALGRSLGVRCDLAEATDLINDYQIIRMLDAIETHLIPGGTVAVLGLSYKPNTVVVEAAHGLLLSDRLANAGHNVVVFDPIAIKSAKSVLGNNVTYADSVEEAVRLADVVAVMTPSPEYSAIKGQDLTSGNRNRVVIDPWRAITPEVACFAKQHIVLGVSTLQVASVEKRKSLAA
jgi:UDPglucose 6-dehydrogenase